MSSTHEPCNEVIVIGAGLSGLAAAYCLKEMGIPVRILEQASEIASVWRDRHPQLRLNTHRRFSSLPGMEMPKAAGAYPARDSVIAYLTDYASALDVPIQFDTSVLRIDSGESGWLVETSAGSYRCAHVIVATGFDRFPHVPAWPGREGFVGELIHSADFGHADRYSGKRVLVVGAGNSGTDVLNHLASVATEQTWVSVRHGPAIFPTRLFGVPIQPLSPLFDALPITAVDRALVVTERIAFGNLERFGMPRDREGGASRLVNSGIAPAIDNGFIASLKAGRVQIRPEVTGFHGSSVRFSDGASVEPDVVIAATGYRTGLERIIGHLGVLDDQGVPLVHGVEQHANAKGLWFTGMRPRLTGNFRAAGTVGREIASAIGGSGTQMEKGDRRMLSETKLPKAA